MLRATFKYIGVVRRKRVYFIVGVGVCIYVDCIVALVAFHSHAHTTKLTRKHTHGSYKSIWKSKQKSDKQEFDQKRQAGE